ncbi:MAG: hypothetical protein QOH35_3046, partial [Acidobacteriaceae bacterium]|nr:hypothetical protein [Acidobacteriaceae bacterium]
GLNRLTVRVDVPNLHDRGADNERTAEEAKRHRQPSSRVEATP